MTLGEVGNASLAEPLQRAVAELARRLPASVELLRYSGEGAGGARGDEDDDGMWRAVRWAVARLPRDSPVLIGHHDMEISEEFLNRVSAGGEGRTVLAARLTASACYRCG